MPGVRDLKNRLQRLRDNMPALLHDSVADTKDSYVEAQKDQLEAGFNSEGERFRPYKSADYAKRKNQMNTLPGYGNPDLKYKGDYYKGIRAEVSNGTLTVHSTDSKAGKLATMYNNDKIFGLTDNKMKDYIEVVVEPVFFDKMRNNLKQS